MLREIREGLAVQGRVLLALILREARTRYGRQRAGYTWALVEPMLHIAVFYFIFRYKLKFVPLGDSLLMFLATGFAVYLGFRDVMSRTQGGYGSNASLLAYPIVQVIDVFLGRAILELFTWLAVIFILFGALILVGPGHFPSSIVTMLVAILALFAIGFGLGVVLGILAEFVPSVTNVMTVPLRLLYFLSGVFFLPDTMPPAIRDVLSWNPVLHGIALFREGYYHSYESHVLDLNYLGGWALGAVLVALVAEKIARKPIRSLA